MIDGIFQQRLQQQLWYQQGRQGFGQLPLNPHPLVTQPHLLNGQITPPQFNFLRQRNQAVVRFQYGAEQLRQIEQQMFGLIGIDHDQRGHGIEGVKKEMRADISLQRCQPGLEFRLGFQPPLTLHIKITHGHSAENQAHQHVAPNPMPVDAACGQRPQHFAGDADGKGHQHDHQQRQQ